VSDSDGETKVRQKKETNGEQADLDKRNNSQSPSRKMAAGPISNE
jgi:hypothetical protein